jgi:hypothetical protein
MSNVCVVGRGIVPGPQRTAFTYGLAGGFFVTIWVNKLLYEQINL